MVITDELKARLRKYLHEIIPIGGSDTDTNFTDDEIEELLQSVDNIYLAAAQGWRLKATTAPMEVGQITKYSIGQETYQKSTASDYLSYCLEMAKMYEEMAEKDNSLSGSRIFKIKAPNVL